MLPPPLVFLVLMRSLISVNGLPMVVPQHEAHATRAEPITSISLLLPPTSTLSFVPIIPSVSRSLSNIHLPFETTTTTTTGSMKFRELVPAPTKVAATTTVKEVVTVTQLQDVMVTVTQRQDVVVTVTVPAKLGELEFPGRGYRGTVMIKVQKLPVQTGVGDGGSQNNGRRKGTPVLGNDGKMIGYLPSPV